MEPNPRDLLKRATVPVDSTHPAPSAMLVFAHPDDETVALGGRLPRFRSATLVHVTDGAPRDPRELRSHGFVRREDYMAWRSRELWSALRVAGLESMRTISLKLVDQEAFANLAYLVRELRKLIEIHSPQVIFTHPYEGGHPDHDACAFAVCRAVSQIDEDICPLIIEAPFYHLGANGMETGCFLPDQTTEEIVWPLSADEQKCKRELLACFSSQQEILRCFPMADERFRIAPAYDFHEAPQASLALYESFNWGMTSQQFCERAREADAAEGVCR